MHRRRWQCIGDANAKETPAPHRAASPMHPRCVATLRPHLLGPHLGGPEIVMLNRSMVSIRWGHWRRKP
eukprot:9485551-Pyramimonas_sp.AAC.1